MVSSPEYRRSLLPEAVERGEGPDEEAAARGSGSGHAHLVERVDAQHLEPRPRLDHERIAVLAEAEHLSAVGPGGGGERVGPLVEPLLLVDLLAGLRLVAGEEAAVQEDVEEVSVDQDRG